MPHHPTSLSRRRLIQWSGAGALALSLPADAWASAPAPRRAAAHLRRSTYAGLQGRAFRAGATPLTLVAVDDLAAAVARPELRGHDEAFVLRFSGPAATPLRSGMHHLAHPDGGVAALFVSPVGDGAAAGYEVIVDRTVRIPAALDALEPELPVAAPQTPPPAAAPPRAAPAAPAAAIATSRPGPSRRLRVKSEARRRGSAVMLDLRFPGGGLQAVDVRLRRKGRTYARGSAAVRRGRAAFKLRRLRPVPRGRYELVLTVSDRSGQATTLTRTLRVR